MTTEKTATKTAKKKTATKKAPAKETAPATKKPAAKEAETKDAAPTKKKPAKKKTSAVDAAAKVLAETKQPMTTSEMIEAMADKGYWKTAHGKTPERTLYSAILREISTKGKESRFKKTERGKFALVAK